MPDPTAHVPLPTAVLADAALRCGVPLRLAPAGIRGPAGAIAVGRARPVRHSGSVDVVLEALGDARAGDVLVVDNDGRRDEACIGDLLVLEAQAAGVAAIVVWGLHRDAAEVAAIGLPVFSYGTLPGGPTALRPAPGDRLERAVFGGATVTQDDVAAADDDGVLFLPADRLDEVTAVGTAIREVEAAQAGQVRAGTSLRAQLGFDDFLRDRARDPSRTFRQHLRDRGRAIEE